MRGAWIEIGTKLLFIWLTFSSLPVRGAWIEIESLENRRVKDLSLPVRGAWIEITNALANAFRNGVAPCEGSVD